MQGFVESEMVPSENNRRARVYELTPAGRRQLVAKMRNGVGSDFREAEITPDPISPDSVATDEVRG